MNFQYAFHHFHIREVVRANKKNPSILLFFQEIDKFKNGQVCRAD